MRRLATSVQRACHGWLEVKWNQTRRAVLSTRTPILSRRRRSVSICESASSVPGGRSTKSEHENVGGGVPKSDPVDPLAQHLGQCVPVDLPQQQGAAVGGDRTALEDRANFPTAGERELNLHKRSAHGAATSGPLLTFL